MLSDEMRAERLDMVFVGALRDLAHAAYKAGYNNGVDDKTEGSNHPDCINDGFHNWLLCDLDDENGFIARLRAAYKPENPDG